MRENFATVLETVADVRADRTAVTHGERSLTWRELDERASRLADYKKPRGIAFVADLQRSPSGKADLQWAQAVAAVGQEAR